MKSSSTEFPVHWLRDRYKEGSLTLRPPYQRKPVWAAKQKSFLIESILLELPVPEVYMQETLVDERVLYAVVDGQQRIRTILQFLGVELEPGEEEYEQFALDKLPADSEWKDQRFSDLQEDQQGQFLRYKIAVRTLETADDATVRSMFVRLNKFLTKLNDQELRNATYTGPFILLAYQLADNAFWVDHRLFTPAQIRRMKDIEFVSELIIGVMHGPQGGSAKLVDAYYQQFEDFDDEFPGQKDAVARFTASLKLVQRLFPKIYDLRWGNRADFYTLFVAVAFMLRTHKLPSANYTALRDALAKFAKNIDARLGDEHAKVSPTARQYVRAVEKGVNDKKRRADRHAAILTIIRPHFDGAE